MSSVFFNNIIVRLALNYGYLENLDVNFDLHHNLARRAAAESIIYFVLGDNRDESMDSSVWTDPESGERIHFIRREDVLGKLRGVY